MIADTFDEALTRALVYELYGLTQAGIAFVGGGN
jgi:hypothetical protein